MHECSASKDGAQRAQNYAVFTSVCIVVYQVQDIFPFHAEDHRSKVLCVLINEVVGTKNGSDCPAKTSLPVLTWQVLHSSHKSETAP